MNLRKILIKTLLAYILIRFSFGCPLITSGGHVDFAHKTLDFVHKTKRFSGGLTIRCLNGGRVVEYPMARPALGTRTA